MMWWGSVSTSDTEFRSAPRRLTFVLSAMSPYRITGSTSADCIMSISDVARVSSGSSDWESSRGTYITRYHGRMSTVVREIRESAGLSQAELATRSGVAQPNIAAYESGSRRASPQMIERLRRAAKPLPHEALAAHAAALESLAGRFGLSNVRVFGSASRGSDHPGSDLDLLVTRTGGVGLLGLASFADAASELLGVEVDVVSDGGLAPGHEILRTAVAV